MITENGEIRLKNLADTEITKEAEVVPTVTPTELDEGIDRTFGRDNESQEKKSQVFMELSLESVAAGLKERKGKPITDNEVTVTLTQEEKETGALLPEAKFGAENPFANTTINPEGVESIMFLGVEAMKKEMKQALEDAGESLAAGEVDKASQIAKELTKRMEQAGAKVLPENVRGMYEDVKKNLDAAINEKDPSAKSRLYKFACGAADFIPVAGPAKMLVEAASGKTLGGESLNGWKRFLHGSEGAVFLAIDLTGFGAVATKLVKAGRAGMLAPKLITRSAALMRTLGAARNVYQPLYKFGRMLVRYPKLGQAATKGLEWMIKERQAKQVKELPKILKEERPEEEEKNVTSIQNRPGMSFPTGERFEPTTA